jgi:FKBP-type peptidyl-prolyl cis-trans isomerase FkpA
MSTARSADRETVKLRASLTNVTNVTNVINGSHEPFVFPPPLEVNISMKKLAFTSVAALTAALMSAMSVHAQLPSFGKVLEAAKTVETVKSAADTVKTTAETAKGMVDAATAPKVVTTASGLKYEDTKTGSGDEAKVGQQATVHYTGWLWAEEKRGNKFDSSKDRGEPFKFPLGGGRVIKGWDEGVVGMKVGGTRILTIPADLGYGATGAGPSIPPNSTLQFEVELLGLQ